jgi:hypothetical protein
MEAFLCLITSNIFFSTPQKDINTETYRKVLESFRESVKNSKYICYNFNKTKLTIVNFIDEIHI